MPGFTKTLCVYPTLCRLRAASDLESSRRQLAHLVTNWWPYWPGAMAPGEAESLPGDADSPVAFDLAASASTPTGYDSAEKV